MEEVQVEEVQGGGGASGGGAGCKRWVVMCTLCTPGDRAGDGALAGGNGGAAGAGGAGARRCSGQGV